jgi:hypothetical protein
LSVVEIISLKTAGDENPNLAIQSFLHVDKFFTGSQTSKIKNFRVNPIVDQMAGSWTGVGAAGWFWCAISDNLCIISASVHQCISASVHQCIGMSAHQLIIKPVNRYAAAV